MLGIVVALPHECQSLGLKRARVGQTLALSPGISVRVAGMGASRSLEAAEALHQQGARALLSWGCAAALAPKVGAGTLMLPERFLVPKPSGYKVCSADPHWQAKLHKILEGLPLLESDLAGSDRILATPTQKQALFKATGSVAADMESAFLASWSAKRQIPFAAVRAISDTASTAIPSAILASDDGEGSISPWRLFGELLFQPQEIPALFTLGLQFRAALSLLTQAAKLLLPLRFGWP